MNYQDFIYSFVDELAKSDRYKEFQEEVFKLLHSFNIGTEIPKSTEASINIIPRWIGTNDQNRIEFGNWETTHRNWNVNAPKLDIDLRRILSSIGLYRTHRDIFRYHGDVFEKIEKIILEITNETKSESEVDKDKTNVPKFGNLELVLDQSGMDQLKSLIIDPDFIIRIFIYWASVLSERYQKKYRKHMTVMYTVMIIDEWNKIAIEHGYLVEATSEIMRIDKLNKNNRIYPNAPDSLDI